MCVATTPQTASAVFLACAACVSPDLVSSSASLAASPSEISPVSCWQKGYTANLCCRAKPTVNCWDGDYTFAQCCGTSNAAVLDGSLQNSGVVHMDSTVAHGGNSGLSRGDSSCWGHGFTYERCCGVTPVAALIDGCWNQVFTKERCCRDAHLIPSSQHREGNERDDLVEVSSSSDSVGDPERDKMSSTGWSPQTLPQTLPVHQQRWEAMEHPQADFFHREGARRWKRYFVKAHEVLDSVSSLDVSLDAVQVYHHLYEAVNQLVAGVQLAFEANRSKVGEVAGNGVNGGTALHSAFLGAAVVLARLAQLSVGTAFENERFAEQAVAAMALSCRRDDSLFHDDMKLRMSWLQRDSDDDPGHQKSWRNVLLTTLSRKPGAKTATDLTYYERTWQAYSEELAQAIWRPADGSGSDKVRLHRGTLNPTSDRLVDLSGRGQLWQIYATHVLSKRIGGMFSSSRAESNECTACAKLTHIVLERYKVFEGSMRNRSSELPGKQKQSRASGVRGMDVNNAFFAWQLTHDVEQAQDQDHWPELYRDSPEFAELKTLAKLACLEYLQTVYDTSLGAAYLQKLDLSIWASVTVPAADDVAVAQETPGAAMGFAFHDHPLALLSGVFYTQAGGSSLSQRTPIAFADPRGTQAFRYTASETSKRDGSLEPTAPFHRLAYAHASTGVALVFPSWLVHGVPPHKGGSTRVAFAFNLQSPEGTAMSSWAKTAQ